MMRCTGVLFSSFQNEFQSTSAQTGAISSIISSFSFYGCTLGGILGNRFGCRIATMIGGVLSIVGMVGGALAKNIYHMYATSTVIGIGNGVAYAPAIVVVANYYDKRYPLACGFMSAGHGLGLTVFGPFIQLLVDTYGWRGALLVTGALIGNICAAGATFRPKPPTCKKETVPADEQSEEELSARQDVSRKSAPRRNPMMRVFYRVSNVLRLYLLCQSYRFAMFCFAQAAYIFCYGSYLLYIVPRANSFGIEDQRAAFLLTAFGIGSLVARPLCGLLNQKVSSMVIYQASMLTSGCFVLLALLDAYPYLVVSAVMVGLAFGFEITVNRVMMREFVGVENFGSAIGLYSAFGGVADLTGPIAAGALYDVSGSFSLLFGILAVFSFVASLAMLSTPLLKKMEPGVYSQVVVDNV
ncbi:monocarboxylate transporter 12-like [Acanthaster planci]|uniref:Monocarboxylate transporter 12-like n=1 Tax=Acanthaster planci TaxID=133434 RepID=A0A8B7YI94_ACAPL|nr:monocarboxylate transporter 12-like [Acanthaster planci]